MSILGIDVGGQSIKAGLLTWSGKVKNKKTYPTPKGKKAITKKLLEIIEEYRSKKVGIGIPGVVSDDGFIERTGNIGLKNFDLGKELRKNTKAKLKFKNDADCFCLAEKKYGKAKGKSVALILTLGTGIGSGLIINKKLFSNNGAPEITYTTINFDNKNSTLKQYLELSHFHKNPIELFKEAKKGNKSAKKKLENYGKCLGIAISNVSNLLRPEIVILGGGVSKAYSFFKKKMFSEIEKRSIFPVLVELAEVQNAGVVGAALLHKQ